MKPLPKALFIIAVICVIAALSSPQAAADGRDAAALFREGNACYEKGEFQKALDAYLAIAGQGLQSGRLYYNIGNAYYKLGDLGRSVLYYEKATRLIPEDADLASNLDYARSLVDEPAATVRTQWWVGLLERATSALNLTNLALVLSAGYLLIVVLILLHVFYRDRAGRKILAVLAVAGTVFAVAAASFAVRVYEKDVLKPAIVVADEAECRFEPIDGSTVYFKVHAGAKVFVLSSKGGWAKIERLDGKKAWIQSGDISLI